MNENKNSQGQQSSNKGNQQQEDQQQGNRPGTGGQQQGGRMGQNNPDTADDRGLGDEAEQGISNRPKDDEGWEGKRKTNPDRVPASGESRRDN